MTPEELVANGWVENEGLARNLCSAVMAYRMGIGMDYCKKKYIDGGELGLYWMKLSAQVNHDLSRQMDALTKPPEGPKLVQ